MELTYFNTNKDLYISLNRLFTDLKLPYIGNGITKPIVAKDFFEKSKNLSIEIVEFVYPLGEVNEDAFVGQTSSLFKKEFTKSQTEGIVLLGITLKKELPTKSELNAITRACNREFEDSPVVVVFKYSHFISIANCERTNFAINQAWREGQKAGKVSLLKDVNIVKVHSGHIRILIELTNIKQIKDVKSFADLYKYWQSVFDTTILNNRFYKDIANWFFWAVANVKYPTDAYLDKENPQEVANQIAVIRLLTRFVFVWFIKEKSLVKEELFDYNYLKNHVLDFNDKNETTYYKAILQNLFFATLNTEMKSENRSFSVKGNSDYLIAKYRYKSYLKNPEQNVKELFEDVPFLNGGLFDFLDKENPKDAKNPIRIDWFSDPDPSKPKYYRENTLTVPDYLFFGDDTDESELLNEIYDTKKQNYTVKGLINILKSYKFTVEENTPIDIEVALDPELLGKVFENLLAYYNPETGKTARKNLGAFYTPREIVNYMVDESLKAYLLETFQKFQTFGKLDEEKLSQLIEYNELGNPFDKETTIHLISALNSIKVLDPACGSGAFPMGVLQKIVYILSKLDHDNRLWKHEQKEKVIGEKIEELLKDKDKLKQLSDAQLRERALKEVENRINEIESEFEIGFRNPDYLRKLYIIQDAIYGVDIQPIAVQISKLRFFLSLIIEQNGNPNEYNAGYVPLPNLETKFVAANTLIGLDKPAQQTLKSTELEKIETEIKEIRQKHFFVKDRREKREIQKQDEIKRKEFSLQLKKDGYTTKVAEQLAGWNPYDQNQTAAFFDVEWMFGLANDSCSESAEITLLNQQIEAINKQIKAINTATKQVRIEPIIKLQFKTANSQIEIIKKEIDFIKNNIEKIYGTIENKIDNVVGEPQNYDYQINTLNRKINEINNQISEISQKLKPASESVSGYFDVVIGNPPYVFARNNSFTEFEKKYFYNHFTLAKYQINLYSLFIEKGNDLLKSYGVLSFIIPNNWLTINTNCELRKFILQKSSIIIVNFLKQVFQSASVDSSIILYTKTWNNQNTTLYDYTDRLNLIQKKENSYFLEKDDFIINLESFKNSDFSKLITKISEKSKLLKDFSEVKAGLQAYEVGKGNPIQTIEMKENRIYHSNKKVDDTYFKYLQGSDVCRYLITWTGEYLKYGENLASPRKDFKLYSSKRILVRQIPSKYPYCINACFTNELYLNDRNSMNIINISILPEYLLAVLNSKLISFWFIHKFGKMQRGIFPQFKINELEIFPIIKISESAQKPFVKIVETIMEKKKKGENTNEEEQEIDRMVYKLYELTDEEIKTVENTN